jgi:Tfp pilus assembly protein PilF
MSPFLQRAQMLIQQSRFELAETELRQALVDDPDNSLAHAFLAICQVEAKQYNEATETIKTAIGLEPDSAFNFYVASTISDARNQFKKAESEILHAISMDHSEPEYFAQLAGLKLQQKKWQAGLEAAETGLEMDPEDVRCMNLRAMALVNLGKKSEAGATIQTALEKSPEDAHSHANMGWSLLERKQPKDAMPHFREALRLEPNMEWARRGIIESMKSQYFIYRMILSWFLWTSKLEGRTVMFVLIGGYFGVNAASRMAENNPALQPFLYPLIIAYVGFVILTWVSVPMFNLLLRFNKFGRLVLSKQEKRISTLVAVCLLLAIGFVIIGFVTGYEYFFMAALASGLMMPIVSTYYQSDPGWPRAVHALMLSAFLIFALLIFAGAIGGYLSTDGMRVAFQGMLNLATTPLIVVAVGCQFAVNFLTLAKPTRGNDNSKMILVIGGILLALTTLVLLAAITFILSMSDQLNEKKDFGPPIRVSYVESENLRWTHHEELESVTQELTKLGFKVGGDFSCKELGEGNTRLLLHSDGYVLADLTDFEQLPNLAMSMSIAKEGDRFVSLKTTDEVNILPPGWSEETVSLSVVEMFREIQKQIEPGSTRRFKLDELAKICEQQHATINDHILNRGGYSNEELGALVTAKDIDLTPSLLEKYQSRSKKSNKKKIEQFVIAEFIKSNPEFADRESSLFCINRYNIDGGAGILGAISVTHYLNNSDKKLFRKLRGIDPNDFRERYFELIDAEKIERVGQTTVPIPTDIYRKKK